VDGSKFKTFREHSLCKWIDQIKRKKNLYNEQLSKVMKHERLFILIINYGVGHRPLAVVTSAENFASTQIMSHRVDGKVMTAFLTKQQGE
jgi:hypothetical protein